MRNKTLGTELPKLTKAQKDTLIPKQLKMEEAIMNKDKATAKTIYDKIKPMLTAENRKSVETRLARLSKKAGG